MRISKYALKIGRPWRHRWIANGRSLVWHDEVVADLASHGVAARTCRRFRIGDDSLAAFLRDCLGIPTHRHGGPRRGSVAEAAWAERAAAIAHAWERRRDLVVAAYAAASEVEGLRILQAGENAACGAKIL